MALAAAMAGPASAQWVERKSVDRMTDRLTVELRAKSKPVASLGSVVATIAVRVRSDDGGDPPEVWLQVPRAVLNCLPRCELSWRVDSESARGLFGAPPEDGSADVLFLGGAWDIVADLERGKRLLVEVPVFRSGRHVIEFSVAGFRLPAITAK